MTAAFFSSSPSRTPPRSGRSCSACWTRPRSSPRPSCEPRWSRGSRESRGVRREPAAAGRLPVAAGAGARAVDRRASGRRPRGDRRPLRRLGGRARARPRAPPAVRAAAVHARSPHRGRDRRRPRLDPLRRVLRSPAATVGGRGPRAPDRRSGAAGRAGVRRARRTGHRARQARGRARRRGRPVGRSRRACAPRGPAARRRRARTGGDRLLLVRAERDDDAPGRPPIRVPRVRALVRGGVLPSSRGRAAVPSRPHSGGSSDG